jgi:phage protein D
VDLAEQVTEVTTAGWDPARGERVAAASSGDQLGPGSGRVGAKLLRDVFGERREHMGHPVVATADEATALAASAFHQRARRFVVLEGKTEGNPLIRVGTHVRVSGASARFNNTYYVVSACHRYDTLSGYVTELEAESAFLGLA